MVTICRDDGLRVVIFADDHEPAHVHVFGDGHTKINLIGSNGTPELVWTEGAKRSEVRRAMRLVNERQESFVALWRKMHA